jgi:hypothetical protein
MLKLEDLKVGQEGEFEGELMLHAGIKIQGIELYGSDDSDSFPGVYKEYLSQIKNGDEYKVFEYIGGTTLECIDGQKLDVVKIKRLK